MQMRMQAPRHCSRAVNPARRVKAVRPAASNGNGVAHAHSGAAAAATPSPAETARTIFDLGREGTLSTVSSDGVPVGVPVSYSFDKAGTAWVSLPSGTPAVSHLQSSAKCSLSVQPREFPARAVGSVTLLGRIDVSDESAAPSFRLQLDKALYFGGLDQVVQEVGAEELMAAEPDVLRTAAAGLVKLWNDERAEDLYRIVSHQLQVPLVEMAYAELLWVDRLGLYVRAEMEGGAPAEGSSSRIIRVPFYRPVLDERDARSVITMAAQIAWEADRNYVPPSPQQLQKEAAANN